MCLRRSTKISSQVLTLSEGIEDGLLDFGSVLVESHMLQHHDGREQQSRWVGESLAGDIRGGSVDGFEDGALVTDVARGGKAETTDETGAHVGENVTVEVWHDQNLIVVWCRVGNHVQASIVQKLIIELDLRVLLRKLLSDLQEQTVTLLHDSSLVHNPNLLLANSIRILESILQNPLASIPSNQLDTLDDTVNDMMFDAGVLALGVFTDENGIYTVVGSLVADDGLAGTDVGEEVECTTESKVEGNVTLADGGGEGSLEGDEIPFYRIDGRLGDGGLAVDENGCDVDGFPVDWNVSGTVDILHTLGDLGSDTVTLDQRDQVFPVGLFLAIEATDLDFGSVSSVPRSLSDGTGTGPDKVLPRRSQLAAGYS